MKILVFLFALVASTAMAQPSAKVGPDTHYRIQCELVAEFGRPHLKAYPPAWKAEWMKKIESASGGCRNGEFILSHEEFNRQMFAARGQVTKWEMADLSQFLFDLQRNSLWNWAVWLKESPEGQKTPGALAQSNALFKRIEEEPQWGKVFAHKDTVELVCSYRSIGAYGPSAINVSYSPSDRWVTWDEDNTYKLMVYPSSIDAGRLQIDLSNLTFSILTLKERHQLPGVPDRVYTGRCVRKRG